MSTRPASAPVVVAGPEDRRRQEVSLRAEEVAAVEVVRSPVPDQVVEEVAAAQAAVQVEAEAEAEVEVEVVVLACEPPQVPSGGLPIMRLAAPAQPSQKPWPAPGPSHRRPGRALAAGLGWSSQ
jgi:hypothetical protein